MKKTNRFLVFMSFFSTIFLLVGTTFSYFSLSARSEQDAIAANAGKIKLGLGVSELYNHGPIIPLLDKYVEIAYERECLDDYERSSCVAYTLEVFNYYGAQNVTGKIDFTIDGIQNLSYMVYDEEDNVYKEPTNIDMNASVGLSFGPDFFLDAAPESDGEALEGAYTSKKFTLVIWLRDTGELQDETDVGSFKANVIFSTSTNQKVTGTVSGLYADGDDTSEMG